MNNQDTIKKLGNKKLTLGIFALLAMLACVVVGSIFPFILDPNKIGTTEWITNELFVVIIVIYCIICVMGIGQATNAMDSRSQIAKAKVKFQTYNDKIVRDTFEQWITQVLEPRDQEKIYKRVLRDVGVRQPEIINLTKSDLKSLIKSPQRINNTWYDEITEKQYYRIVAIKDGVYNIKFVDAGYYLTDKHIETELTRSERAIREQKVKSKLMTRALIGKVAMTLILGVIFSMFVVDLAQEQDAKQTILQLVSRLVSLASSSYAGYLLGCEQNDLNASYIEMKADTQKEQLEDTSFKPKSVEEIAKEKFAKKVQLENQKEVLGITEQPVIKM